MIELLSICVLTLIACVAFLFWYTMKLHDLITKTLKLTEDNTNLISKVREIAFDTDSKMFDMFKLHLEKQHGIYDESEGIDDGK